MATRNRMFMMLTRAISPLHAGRVLTPLLILLPATSYGRIIQKDFSFHFPEVDSCVDASQTHCQPWSGEYAINHKDRYPEIPVASFSVVLDQGEQVGHVRVELGNIQSRPYKPYLNPEQVTFTPSTNLLRTFSAWSGGEYPENWITGPKLREFRGQTIATWLVTPWHVTSGDSESHLESMTLEVETIDGPKSLDPSDRHLVRDRIAAEEIANDEQRRPDDDKVRIIPPSEEVTYLIIGPRELIGTKSDSPLNLLIKEKESRHLNVVLITTEEMDSPLTPATLRARIKQAYQTQSVDYVLLVGDKENIPWKYVHSGMNGDGDPVPSDQYYACLDGTFESPSTIDWDCEVSVGRIGAKTRADVSNWAAKYQSFVKAVDEKRTQLFLHFGEKLDNRTLGRRMLDYLINGRSQAPTTKGYPASIKVTALSEDFRSEVSAEDFADKLNSGDFHVVNHLGHANQTYVFKMSAGEIPKLTSRPAFFYSQGCYPNDPEQDNWTIRAVRAKDFGPVSMISNTRFGWYSPGDEGEGSSSLLHRTFWSMLFEKKIHAIGTMNHRAKAEVVKSDDSDVVIYTALESNLIGDPELDLGLHGGL